ncbi:MAG: hypothetical protein HY856_02285 [Burkholderiales bacterium]|nr:hypothetical protein [Burkholderiales bacterium]
MSASTVSVLLAARRVADFAEKDGALQSTQLPRPTLDHMGAIVADAVLQAGLNYATVVRPRVTGILKKHPDADRVSVLAKLVESRQVATFLNWNHPTKITRFEQLVHSLTSNSIERAEDLREGLRCSDFRASLRTISGVGPKTVDYLACLVGVDSIAVDRHVRTYADRVGVDSRDYDYVQEVFCCAADLLKVSRREFDAWVWRQEAVSAPASQLALGF